jgi:antitoxin component of MazEF toxin-antitoxin module
MQTKLIKTGNSFCIKLPKVIVNQYSLENSQLEIIAAKDGILLKPTLNVPPLSHWDDLFKEAKRNGFNAKDDLKEFKDWHQT